MDKISRAHGGCLGTGSRRRTRQAAISCGEGQTPFDPQVSEWGNPPGVMPRYPILNKIGMRRATGGTETSKYPEEEKSTEIARVAASESAPAQTRARVSGRRCRPGVAGHPSRCCPPGSTFREILNSDAPKYGGQGRLNESPIRAKKVTTDKKKETAYELTCYLPPLSVVVLEYDYKK